MCKMNGLVIFLLLSAVVLFSSALQWDNYGSFPEVLKKHVNKAIMEANKIFTDGNHINFLKLEKNSTVTSINYFVAVKLIPTTCARAESEAQFTQRSECSFPKNVKMLIDCVVCNRKNKQELVHCVKFKDVEKLKWNRDNCSVVSLIGAGHMLAQKSDDSDQQIGCIGCV